MATLWPLAGPSSQKVLSASALHKPAPPPPTPARSGCSEPALLKRARLPGSLRHFHQKLPTLDRYKTTRASRPFDGDDIGRALRRPVIHRFDIVAIRIDQERGVIAGVVRALPGLAVVLATGRQSLRVKALDHVAARCLERDMRAPGQRALRGDTLGRRDEQFVGPEKTVALAADRNTERVEHRRVKAPTRRQIAHHEVQMIDQAAACDCIGYHGRSSVRKDQKPARANNSSFSYDRSLRSGWPAAELATKWR